MERVGLNVRKNLLGGRNEALLNDHNMNSFEPLEMLHVRSEYGCSTLQSVIMHAVSRIRLVDMAIHF